MAVKTQMAVKTLLCHHVCVKTLHAIGQTCATAVLERLQPKMLTCQEIETMFVQYTHIFISFHVILNCNYYLPVHVLSKVCFENTFVQRPSLGLGNGFW